LYPKSPENLEAAKMRSQKYTTLFGVNLFGEQLAVKDPHIEAMRLST
jgi:hypothetical protein